MRGFGTADLVVILALGALACIAVAVSDWRARKRDDDGDD